jgi:hypothetical protein
MTSCVTEFWSKCFFTALCSISKTLLVLFFDDRYLDVNEESYSRTALREADITLVAQV